MNAPRAITLRGVRVHNLKNIDVSIPLDRLTVVVGVSGAGKSSLVFDTLYAESQRRYLQSFSTYTRQFLERFEKPDAEEIGDLPPAIAIRASPTRSPRSTVGSLTEIDDDLRSLFARTGTLFCVSCGQVVTAHRPHDVLAALHAMPAGTRCNIAFPVVLTDDADQAAWLAGLLEEGYIRIQIGSTVYRLDESATPIPRLTAKDKSWVLLDRVEAGKTPTERLSESVDLAFRRGQGQLVLLTDNERHIFDQRYFCPRCERVYPSPEPRRLDFNDPLGACPECQGTGTVGKTSEVCSACQGSRFNSEALALKVGGMNIAEWYAQPLRDLLTLVQVLELPDEPGKQTGVLLEQIRQRLGALVAMDLDYLTLSQSAAALSEGETKRIALTTALASNLVHVLYLVDEPTTSLHPRDVEKLLHGLLTLRDRGNTVVVIEHDHRIIAAADHVIELGPGAGEEGGEITYQGPPRKLETDAIETPTRRRKPTGFLKLGGASINNLQNLTVEFPLGVLCVVTGVNGAGKSSLVEQTLYQALSKPGSPTKANEARITGAPRFADVVLLDQSPLPRSSRSNAATYLKIFDEIRGLFAETVDARIRNFGAGVFSFNQPGGRCETCEGEGTITIDMRFLADVVSTCPDCQGQRYRKEILEITVRSLSIAEVLNLTIREAFRFFRAQPKIEKKLKWLLDVGLDYVRLGQSVETFSGGECQRLRLAGHLASRKAGCLFLLVEPSAGLHPAEVANLLECFDRMLAAGHSLIAVEYDLDVIKNADYVIDLGPEGGRGGGRMVACGTPEEVTQVAESHTGNALKSIFGKRRGIG